MRRLTGFLAVAAAAAAIAAPAAFAVPNCTPVLAAPQTIYSGGGVLESLIVDNQGRLYFTDTSSGMLMRMDRPGTNAYPVRTGLWSAGGLALDADPRYMFVGQGDGFVPGLLGNLTPTANLIRFDTQTSAIAPFAQGLRMANGVARAPDGTLYASSDVGTSIDRISPTGVVTNDWAPLLSGNGMVVDPGGHWLYVNQTFVPAAIKRIPLDHPGPPETYARPGVLDVAAGLDGLTMDPAGRLVAAANSGLSIWRVNADRSICALARGVLLPSSVAYGKGSTGFSAGHLYAATFSGSVVEIPSGFVPGA